MSEAQKILDMRAIEIAVRAETKIDSSQINDTERYNTLISKIDEIKRSQDILFKRWWSVAGSIILILISGVAYLFGKAFP